MLSFNQFIVEVLDNPFNTTELAFDHPITKAIKKEVSRHIPDVSMIKVHSLDDGKEGHMFSFYHNGAHEIHHINKEGISGEKTIRQTSSPNPRFVATMTNRALDIVKSGYGVRIVSPESLSKNYYSLGKRISKKHNLEISNQNIYDHSQDKENKYHSFEISNKKKWFRDVNVRKKIFDNGE